jgi:hypothetical protein
MNVIDGRRISDVAGGWRYQFNEPLMSRVGILVSLDRFLQPVLLDPNQVPPEGFNIFMQVYACLLTCRHLPA